MNIKICQSLQPTRPNPPDIVAAMSKQNTDGMILNWTCECQFLNLNFKFYFDLQYLVHQGEMDGVIN